MYFVLANEQSRAFFVRAIAEGTRNSGAQAMFLYWAHDPRRIELHVGNVSMPNKGAHEITFAEVFGILPPFKFGPDAVFIITMSSACALTAVSPVRQQVTRAEGQTFNIAVVADCGETRVSRRRFRCSVPMGHGRFSGTATRTARPRSIATSLPGTR